MISTTESSVTDRDRHGSPAAPRRDLRLGVGRVARWVACATVAACALVGAALPAQAIGDPVPIPSAPPTQAPATGLLPGHTIRISAELQYGQSVPTKDYLVAYSLNLIFSSYSPGEDMTPQECQELVDTFWSGGGDDYYAEASFWSTFCEVDAYYMGEARHAFYSVDEAGHLQVRGPMAYLNQVASSFEDGQVISFRIDFTNVNNARCNANPTHETVDHLLIYSHKTTCEWDTDKGGVIPTSDEPLIEGDIEQAFFGDFYRGTVGPFVAPVAPINPFTITPPPATNPAADPSAAGGQDTSSDSSSAGLLIGIGATAAALLLVAAGSLIVALRRRKK